MKMHPKLEAVTTNRTPTLTAHGVAALVIVREDGTCTVAWGRAWCVWERMPGVWPNPKEAMRAVQQVVGKTRHLAAYRASVVGGTAFDLLVLSLN